MAPTLWFAHTTVAKRSDAESLARLAVEQRLAACVQTEDGVFSTYRWQGKLEVESEFRLSFKTTETRLPKLREALLAAHPYDTPEWVAWPVPEASAPYQRWVEEQVTPTR